MANAVLVQTSVQATNIDALNRNFVSVANVNNGSIFSSGALSANVKQDNVFQTVAPAAGEGLKNLYMAYSPEVVVSVSGNLQFKGLDSDPRNFTNLAGVPFNGFKPVVGDLIQLTADGFTANRGAENFAVATAGQNNLVWGNAAVAGLSFKLIATRPITIASASITNQNVTAYILECVAVA